MKLANLNNNNIRLGYSKVSSSNGYSSAVPMSFKQAQKANIDTDEELVDDETLGGGSGVDDGSSDVDKVKSKNNKTVDLVAMANSWSPDRRTPDIRRVPNMANLT